VRDAAGRPRLLGAADARRIAARIGLRPTKKLGQSFVVDPNTVRRIAKSAALGPDDVVLEIGPGLGSLTLALLPEARRVVAVEIDRRLAGALGETVAERAPAYAERLVVIATDALRLDAVPDPPPTALVANLPYNVAVPVLLGCLRRFASLSAGLVTVQAEVAERLVAAPGSPAYGIPSAKLAWYAQARRAGSVPRTAFWPVPGVDSGLVAFTRRPPPPTGASREQVFACVDTAFARRRKSLRAALATAAGSGQVAAQALRAAGIDPGARGESLAIADFARLAEAMPERHGTVAPGEQGRGPF
jgi:16S rRNA (adenine1518-N6/adenine1519-N6)-dimethyltransferase